MFLDQINLQENIEDLINSERINYMEAVIKYCEINDIEYSDINKSISPSLRDKIRKDAIDNGYMEEGSILPI